MSNTPSHILITGASSGIGQALAEHYAAPGITLSLCGRDSERLEAVAKSCTDMGAHVDAGVLDVSDKEAMERWVISRDQEISVDLVIANAGISGGTAGDCDGESDAQVRRIFAVNVDGVFNTIQPLLPKMLVRKSGQIAIMSSLAGCRGWPSAPAYCASKAAVKTYGEALRGQVASAGVKVNVICPGFVRSRITAVNDFPMPFLMDADKAAALIIKKLQQNKGLISFPWPISIFCWFCLVLPNIIVDMGFKFMPAKGQLRV